MNRLFEEPAGLPLSKDAVKALVKPAAKKPAGKQSPAATVPGHVVGVAVNTRVWEAYDYLFPLSMGQPQLGQRVHVPFGMGNRKIVGFIVEIDRPHTSRRLKVVADVIDPKTPFTPGLWELGEWIARYYLAPLGQTLAAMVPSAVGGKTKPRKTTFVRLLVKQTDWPKKLGKNQRVFLDELREAQKQGLDEIALDQLRKHHPITPASLRSLVGQDLVATESRTTLLDSLGGETIENPFELNDDQQAVCDKFLPALDTGFSVSLLQGVTGSGKTEVYIRAIQQVIAAGKQAILLTPEIALATQTLQRLVTRLPNVAVLHSGLSAAQRAFYWQQIADGHASVVIGPRSAVFAPTPHTGLIIVDEEHESTYKQDNDPRYHGRDVAIKRGAIENIPVLLGSATPALESLHNAHLGKYKRLSLPRRVRHLPMPKLEIVNLRKELSRDGKTVELLGRTLTYEMAGALDRNEQIILLMNRRGYASYVFCPSCEWTLSCEDCDRPMVWHTATQLASCHHCNNSAGLPAHCPACKGKLLLFGYGIQRVEDELVRKFPLARVARMDSDTMTSPKQFQKVLSAFSDGEIDILLGTQMVAKGLDFPRVSLVGVVSADTTLTQSDFRSAERTFQLIVQVAGRAGRGDTPGKVVVQTLHPEEPIIEFARNQDVTAFSEFELQDRNEMRMPPFARIVRFIIRHEKNSVTQQCANEFAARLKPLLAGLQYEPIGPFPAEYRKIRNQYRFFYQVLTTQPGLVQQRIHGRMHEITRDLRAEVYVDVDPANLM